MIVPFSDLLDEARSGGRAALAFTSYDIATAAAAVAAAEQREAGVILLVSSESFRAPTGPALVAALLALADAATVPACVQLDHESDLERVESAVRAGVGAVMVDGSRLPFEENIALVAEAKAVAERHGVQLEAELGHIEGDEDIAVVGVAGALTEPDEAAEFVERTGAACLAISIGNVHGSYREPPRLDWDRLEALSSAVGVPLSLHGASGLSAEDLRRAISGGIVKVNVNTELREAWFRTILADAPELALGAQLLRLQAKIHDAITQVACSKLDGAWSTRLAAVRPSAEKS